MKLAQIRQFITLAETLNFRKAADRLSMAQPPLSVSIRKLEEELGVDLFQRDSGVILTEAGKLLLEDARKTLFYSNEMVRNAKLAKSGDGGILRIGFVGSATYTLLPRILPKFRERYPGIELQLIESNGASILSKLEAGELDVGFVRTPVITSGNIELLSIEKDVLALALPSHHPLAKSKRGIQLEELAGSPFVMYSPEEVPGMHALILLLCQKSGFLPKAAQEAIQVQTVLSLVASGLGVALVPSVCIEYSTAQIAFKQLQGLGRESLIGMDLAYKSDSETVVARKFRQFIQEII